MRLVTKIDNCLMCQSVCQFFVFPLFHFDFSWFWGTDDSWLLLSCCTECCNKNLPFFLLCKLVHSLENFGSWLFFFCPNSFLRFVWSHCASLELRSSSSSFPVAASTPSLLTTETHWDCWVGLQIWLLSKTHKPRPTTKLQFCVECNNEMCLSFFKHADFQTPLLSLDSIRQKIIGLTKTFVLFQIFFCLISILLHKGSCCSLPTDVSFMQTNHCSCPWHLKVQVAVCTCRVRVTSFEGAQWINVERCNLRLWDFCQGSR